MPYPTIFTMSQLWLGLQMDYKLDLAEDILEDRLKKEVKPKTASG